MIAETKIKSNEIEPEFFRETKSERMTLDRVKEAIEKQSVLESQVISCDNELTVKVRIGTDIIGIISFEEMEFNLTNEPTKAVVAVSKVGKHIKYVPLSVSFNSEYGKYEVICSRKMAQKRCYYNYINKLTVGDIVDARIVRVEKYGAFCDIGCGIVGLLPMSNVSYAHTVDGEEAFRGNTSLKVIINSIKDGKIQLSIKELLGTWEQEASKFAEGQIVCGKILRKEDYGVFVKISQNLAALSSSSYEDNFDNISVGDTVSVRINSINKVSNKIKVTILDKADTGEMESCFHYYIKDGHIDKFIYSKNEVTGRVVEKTFTD